jgi:hypothetical protein
MQERGYSEVAMRYISVSLELELGVGSTTL